jgi:predicted N-acyltransferase
MFGRNWGCRVERPFLHMELCFYQAIEEAIATKLSRVEAGAQGEHKMQRGYLPTPTYSAHYIRSPEFRRPIADFLNRERQEMARVTEELTEESPYKVLPTAAQATAA